MLRVRFHLLLVLVCTAPLASFGPLQAQTTIKVPPSKGVSALATGSTKEDTGKVLVVFGDSISAGYGVPAGESFPDELQKTIHLEGLHWRVVNLGISGDTTSGGAARLATALAQKPAVVLLELGGNDGLRGTPLATTRSNMERMIVSFQNAGARVVLAGMTLPPNYGMEYVRGFERIYSDLAAKYKLTLIPFLFSDIITKDLRYFQRDGIHPTAEGAEIVANTVLRSLRPLLTRN